MFPSGLQVAEKPLPACVNAARCTVGPTKSGIIGYLCAHWPGEFVDIICEIRLGYLMG